MNKKLLLLLCLQTVMFLENFAAPPRLSVINSLAHKPGGTGPRLDILINELSESNDPNLTLEEIKKINKVLGSSAILGQEQLTWYARLVALLNQ